MTSSDNGADGASTRAGLPGAAPNLVAEAGDGSLDADGNQATNAGDAPTSFTVNGKVLDYSAAPLAGYQVAIGNQSALSASDGTFVIRGVTAPYKAVITNPRNGGACVYVGLTRSDPLLALPFGKAPLPAQASVTVLPSEPTLTTPPDLYASADNTTVFAWSAPANRGVFDFFVQEVQFEGVPDSGCCELWYMGAGMDIYEVITASPEASLADFLAHATIFPGFKYYWGVRAYPDRTSVDDAASTHYIDWECSDSAKSPEGGATCVTTPTRRFVTK